MRIAIVYARVAAPLLASLLMAAPVIAQRAPGTGTAAGLGLTATVEARRADAALWNPALVGIYDGPLATHSLFSLDLGRLPGADYYNASGRLGLVGGESRAGRGAREFGEVLPGGSSLQGGLGAVVWGAFQSRETALSLLSEATQYGRMPAAVSAALGGDQTDDAGAAGERVGRSVVSALTLTRAVHLGQLPGIGSVWAGGTARGWLLHTYAAGRYTADVPGAEIYRESVFSNVPGYGLDVGVAARPGRMVLSAALTNVLQGRVRPERGPRERIVSLAQSGEVTTEARADLERDDPAFEDAERAWEQAYFPARIRAGASLDLDEATVSVAASERLRAGWIHPSWVEERVAAGVRLKGRLPLRFSYGIGEADSRAIGIGVQAGSCMRRWNVGASRRAGPDGTSLGLSAALTFGDASCLPVR